jgi:hypothetical protein
MVHSPMVASLLMQASQKARIIAASEGLAFASTTSWCQSQLQAEASHCKQWQDNRETQMMQYIGTVAHRLASLCFAKASSDFVGRKAVFRFR